MEYSSTHKSLRTRDKIGRKARPIFALLYPGKKRFTDN